MRTSAERQATAWGTVGRKMPQASPKRAGELSRENPDDDPGEQPLTLALLQQALQGSQQQITNSIRESLRGLGTRVSQIEVNINVEEHVHRTTNLDAMMDSHCHIWKAP